MTKLTFQKLGDKIKMSPFVVPIYIVLLFGFVLSLVLIWSDFFTGYYGVKMLPVRAPVDDLDRTIHGFRIIALASLPQVSSVIAGYISLSLDPDTDKEESILVLARRITLFSLAVDGLTGMFYYFPFVMTLDNLVANPFEAMVALFLAGVVDTAGSEILFVITLGLIIYLKKDFKQVWNEFVRSKEPRASRTGGSSRSGGSSGSQSRGGSKGSGSQGGQGGRNSYQPPRQERTSSPSIANGGGRGGV